MNAHRQLSSIDWRHEVLQLLILAMESCWLYPWAALLDQWLTQQRHFSSPLELFFILVGLFWISRLLQRLPFPSGMRQILLLPVVLLSVLVVIKIHLYAAYPWFSGAWLVAGGKSLSQISREMPAEVEVFVIMMYCWWRALNLSQKRLDADTVGFYFRVGVASLIWYLLVTIFAQTIDVTPLAFAFFFFGLIAMALARTLTADTVHRGKLSSSGGPWLSIVLGATVGTLAVGMLMTFILSPQTATLVSTWLRPVTGALSIALYYLVMLIAYLTQPLINFLTAVFSDGLRGLLGTEENIIQPPQPPGLENPVTEPPWWLGACNWAALIFFLVISLLIVITTLRRWQQKRQTPDDLTRESVWSAEEFGAGLRSALRQGWGKMSNLSNLMQRYGIGRRLYTALSVRKIYASLVELAAEQGFPRPPATTPYEYLPTLHRAFPQHGTELATITEAYVRVHYGEVPADNEELARLRKCWERVRRST